MIQPSPALERADSKSTLPATILLVGSLVAACEGGASTPTGPSPPPAPQSEESSHLTLDISVDLEARSTFVLIGRAMLLYDGSTLRTSSICLDSPLPLGCRRERLSASSRTTRGAHAVALRLVSHTFDLLPSIGKATYDAAGTVSVRDRSGELQEITLGERTESLAPGDSITYSIDVRP